jgi:YidC/Oxa1 family membrane protein insertase
LIEKRNRKSIKIEPRYYALNIVSEYPETAELIYEVKYFSKDKIVFETVQHHRTIRKTFSLAAEDQGAPYTLNLTVEIEGDGRGLWLTSGIPEVEWISGGPAPTLKYRITRNHKPSVENIDLPKDAFTLSSVYPDWIGNSNGFFGTILNPITPINPGFRAQYVSGNAVPSRLIEIEQDYQKYKAQDLPGYMMMLPLNSKGGSMEFHVYAGPFADDTLAAVDKFYSDPATGYNPDFIAAQSFHGWFSFISEPFADFLFILMKFFHYLTNSWALSIILLTVALRLMLYPLNAWSMKSMAKMQQIAPEVTAIQEKYKKDPKKVQVEIMNLYRARGVNPMSGCLPMLIQMPFLIGMFDLLKSTFELRGASFIPGWIDDLTAPDVLFSWNTPIFFIGNQFHLLPILLGLVMFLQQRMSTTLPKDPKLWTEQQRQQRTMGTIMSLVFAVMFYNFPSGLNIYWLSSMLLSILQQWWTQRRLKPTQPQPQQH